MLSSGNGMLSSQQNVVVSSNLLPIFEEFFEDISEISPDK